ncbi:hypothetical protein HMPREF3067_02700 [Corynebacterium sp. HMSC04H06]|nr:hypothetical protein HMPREF3067_02700 [Corynebacterium sp. HMSC04H06]
MGDGRVRLRYSGSVRDGIRDAHVDALQLRNGLPSLIAHAVGQIVKILGAGKICNHLDFDLGVVALVQLADPRDALAREIQRDFPEASAEELGDAGKSFQCCS